MRIADPNGCRFYCRQFNRKTLAIVNGAWVDDRFTVQTGRNPAFPGSQNWNGALDTFGKVVASIVDNSDWHQEGDCAMDAPLSRADDALVVDKEHI
ncbi:hypothetical protein, partial [Mesorhizobium sp. M7A.F.Ca.CA.004.02.1.1]